MIGEIQKKFMINEIWILTFAGGLQRSNTYRSDIKISEDTRSEFRLGIQTFLNDRVFPEYAQKKVNDSSHDQLIADLTEWSGANFSSILNHGRLKLGVAQKIINLNLKYLWCIGMICEPPHCPFDSKILSKIRKYSDVKWTMLDDIHKYREIVNEARKEANCLGLTLSQWELMEFQRKGDIDFPILGGLD